MSSNVPTVPIVPTSLLTFTPTQIGSKAELYGGMWIVEINPEYCLPKEPSLWGWYGIMINLRWWSRDQFHDKGDRRWYFPATKEGLKGAEAAAEMVVRRMVEDMCKRIGKEERREV